ncbi:response regulator transcription factor [Kocuria sp.]|uniref:response regulator transcription factor n=1 Tax=Kocuria sp. TaxID=1871328 RepID=UPI0026DCFA8B|nr:response regulator transcription factor [Kocuria sp.]MDO4920161.1 response regulator transcription factor [Kocuria sp.]
MSHIALLSRGARAAETVLPALQLLAHHVVAHPFEDTSALAGPGRPDLVLVDGTADLVAARNAAQSLSAAQRPVPVLLVVTEGGMAAVAPSWRVADVVLDTAGPAEVEARVRLASAAGAPGPAEDDDVIRAGAVSIHEDSYTVKLAGRPLNLTFKEFELLKFLAQHVGRVFTRHQLLSEVWGYDYYGGTRTVDVHIRRLRAKLGADHEHLITTVRNVGYSFTTGRESSP